MASRTAEPVSDDAIQGIFDIVDERGACVAGGELFYAMPAEFIMPGTSTSDGYDVQAVDVWGGHVALTVHIRLGELPLHPAARVEPATRFHQRRELVELCVFADTALDMSRHPQATAVRLQPPSSDVPAAFQRFRRRL